MSVALYMDEHVPRSITSGLRLRRVDVLTVQEDGLSGSDDRTVLDRATKLQRVVFSQDEDFLIEAKQRQTAGIHFTGIIYAHQNNISIGKCIHDLELIAQVADFPDLLNQVQYLPL